MFKVGDRVRVVEVETVDPLVIGDMGTVLEESYVPFVRFDRDLGNEGGSALGVCEEGHGYPVVDTQIELIKEETPCD